MYGTAHAFVSVGCVHVYVYMFMHMETSRRLRGSLHFFFFLIHGLSRTLKLIDSARLADEPYTGIIGTCCHAQLVKQQNQKPNVGSGNLTSGSLSCLLDRRFNHGSSFSPSVHRLSFNIH